MYPSPETMSRKGRRRFLEKSIDLAPTLIAKHDKLHLTLANYFDNPAGDEMEMIRQSKHPDERLNETYKDYKNILREIKMLEYAIKLFVEYDGGDKPIQGNSNKKSTRLHTSH